MCKLKLKDFTLIHFTLQAKRGKMPCGRKRKLRKIRTHKRKKMRRRLRHLKKRAWG